MSANIDLNKNEILKKFRGKGLTGLSNLGNTCYMNSALHCISNTLPLTYYFISEKFLDDYDEDKQNSRIVKEWYRLLGGIWESNCTIAPCSFHKSVQQISSNSGGQVFGNFSQNDVDEFLVFFIDTMHEALGKEVEITITGTAKNETDQHAIRAMNKWKDYFKNSYSILIDLFYGQFVCKTNRIDGIKSCSYSYDPFCQLTLPIPENVQNINIYDCIDLLTKDEKLEGDSKWFDEDNNEYVDAIKKYYFWSLPKILILTLKRFDRTTSTTKKKDLFIDFPTNNLNLEKYCIGYDKKKANYSLYGICNHFGDVNFGHYYAYCKNSDGNWYNYDDQNVFKLENNSIKSNHAYVLFYQKTSN
tara:strand:+ start:60 stop:1136 length:1077 start_codon:yes stop_codon:yes gene_type:complete